MGWGLSSWLGLVRCIQILASLVASALQGFLLGYISINRLGPAHSLPVLQGMITASLVFSALALVFLKTGKRFENAPWLVAAIGGDVLFIGILVAEITILAQAGLPSNCAGLTRTNILPGDSRNEPKSGYTSIRFSGQWNGEKGELDRYCAMGRVFYIIVVALVFAFIASIIVEVLLLVAGSYTKNSKVQEQIREVIDQREKRRSKRTSVSSAGDQHHTPTTAPSAAHASQLTFPQPHPQQPHAQLPQMPRHDSSSAHTIPSPASPITPIQQQQQQQHYLQAQHHQAPLRPLYGDQSASSSSASRPPVRTNNFGYETPEDEAAAAALITDGSRSDPEVGLGLPPRYTPGRAQPGSSYQPGGLNPMPGHGDESNDIRLSDYVKGETRAQNMKDGLP